MSRLFKSIVSDPPSQPFLLLRSANAVGCELFVGSLCEHELLRDLASGPGVGTADGPRIASASIVPFRQAIERGFEVADGDERILSLEVSGRETISVTDLCSAIDPQDLFITDGSFNWSDDEYAQIVRSIVRNEIEAGEGANFVVPRIFRGRIQQFAHAKALAAFRYLIEAEYGAYWTFLFYTGRQYFLGASPERLISVLNGMTRMNPISGTFRKGSTALSEQKAAVLRFLDDDKEIFELFMVVNEELKVMAEICPNGGQIVGPYIKEMSKLIHTEYLLVGRSNLDPIAQLRASMFAATVTGSPVENAFRIIKKYQPESRRYYGSALVLLGEQNGAAYLDSAITIRTVEIDSLGNVFAPVGATLVRNSVPEEEVAETNVKLAALLDALRGNGARGNARPFALDRDEDVLIELSARNSSLGRFWFETQSKNPNRYRSARVLQRRVCIIDNEDRFVEMLAHMIRAIGADVTVKSWRDVHDSSDLDYDIVVMGPGPGDPNDLASPRIGAMHRIGRQLVEKRRRILAVCLGHQVLSSILGLAVGKRHAVAQGRQATIDLFGTLRVVGFYNTFVATGEPDDRNISVARESDSGDVVALRGPSLASFQFHAESILTQEGPEIVREALEYLCGCP